MQLSLFTSIFNRKLGLGFSVLLLTLGILYSISHFVKKLDSNSVIGESISNISADVKDVDVLIMGDSRSHQGVDPRILENELFLKTKKEIKTHNFARAGMQTPFFYYVLLDYLQDTEKKPKVVLINISFYLLAGTDWLNSIYLSYYKPKLWQVLDALESQLIPLDQAVGWYLKTHIPFLRYRQKLRSGVIEVMANSKEILPAFLPTYTNTRFFQKFQFDSSNKGYFSRGMEKINEVEDFEAFKSYKTGIENGYSIYINYLKKFFELALRYNYKIIVYGFPYPSPTNTPEFNNILDYYQKIIEKTADGNPNVIFIQDKFFWEPQLFADPLHLNQNGANVLTKMAAEWIEPYCK